MTMVRTKVGRKKRAIPTAAPALKITDPQVLELWVKAGGRCELQGCNDYLLQDKLTTNKAKLGDVAHIVARSRGGPRGNDAMPIAERNKIENLFLACPKHHREIDTKALVAKYPKELLLHYKQAHEERVRFVTGLSDDHETTIIRLIGRIRNNSVSISNEEIRDAVLKSSLHYPRYIGSESHIEIDLTSVSERDLSKYWADGCDRIKDVISRLLVPAIEKHEIKHLSVFAFARIPFLAYLGQAIGDKVPLEVFQKHRAGKEAWVWEQNGSAAQFNFNKERTGSDQSCVAVQLSLSGCVVADRLPESIDDRFSIYSILPQGISPSRDVFLSKNTLENFRAVYASLLREIESKHPLAREIHLFPAVPISAAILLGREMLSGVTPTIVIYDVNKRVFERALLLSQDHERRNG